MLCALVSAQRVQTLHILNTQEMVELSTSLLFLIPQNVKQSRPGTKRVQVMLEDYHIEPCLSAF